MKVKLIGCKKLSVMVAIICLMQFGITSVAAHAQTVGGCDDSPENPTFILAILAGAAFCLFSYRHKKNAARQKKGTPQG